MGAVTNSGSALPLILNDDAGNIIGGLLPVNVATNPNANRALRHKVHVTLNATAAETTLIAAGAAGVFNDVYAFIVTNTSATPTTVTFRDATGGTVQMVLDAPANDTRGFTVAPEGAMPQTNAASNWTAQCGVGVTSIEITALYVSTA